MSENKEFSFKEYWGSELLRPFVEHSKKGLHHCIYCGSIADSREHVPSRTFLNKPVLDDDLPTLPSCQKCNNGFSSDELYTKTYIECVKSFFGDNDPVALELQPDDRKEVIEAKNAVKQAYKNGSFTFDNRIARILYKLAIGHIAYELYELIHLNSLYAESFSINYVFKCSLDEESWDSLETFEPIDDSICPEIGSRAFRNMYVIEPVENGAGDINVVMGWTDIQEGVYRYIAFYKGNEIVVKMIIRDYLYAEVKFRKNH